MTEPTDIISDYVRERKTILLSNTVLVLLSVLCVFWIKALLALVTLRLAGLTFGISCCVLAWFYSRWNSQRVALALTFGAYWVCVVIAVLTTGALEAATLSWFPISICLAGLLGGRRFCQVWSVVSLLTILAIWFGHWLWPAIDQLIVDENKVVQLRLHIMAQMAVMVAVVLSFTDMNQKYEAYIVSQTRQLNEEVEQRRKAEAEATHSNHAKTQFLANMSHEIRTPLNSIIGFSKRILVRDELTDPRDKEAIESVYRNGKGLLTLFNELLDFANLEANHLQYSAIPFSVSGVVDDCLMSVEPIARQYGLQINSSCEEDLTIEGDRNRVAQIISSLLYFSIRQAMEGVIDLHVCRGSRNQVMGVSITVTDTSQGIAPEQLENLFESHYQFVLNSNKELPISALSMVLSAKLVSMHSGSLEAKSDVGRGTQFLLWLPCEKPNGDPQLVHSQR